MENNVRTILFVGKPGSGKGTQAKLLAEQAGWRIITAGEQFRRIASEDTPFGRKTKSFVEAGTLMPSWFATYLFLASLFSIRADEHIIFDGFGRKLAEAEMVVESMTWLARPLTVIHVQISDETARERLTKRKGIEGRADDANADIINERLKEYEEHTRLSIELFRRTDILIDIDGERTQEAITNEIRERLYV